MYEARDTLEELLAIQSDNEYEDGKAVAEHDEGYQSTLDRQISHQIIDQLTGLQLEKHILKAAENPRRLLVCAVK